MCSNVDLQFIICRYRSKNDYSIRSSYAQDTVSQTTLAAVTLSILPIIPCHKQVWQHHQYQRRTTVPNTYRITAVIPSRSALPIRSESAEQPRRSSKWIQSSSFHTPSRERSKIKSPKSNDQSLTLQWRSWARKRSRWSSGRFASYPGRTLSRWLQDIKDQRSTYFPCFSFRKKDSKTKHQLLSIFLSQFFAEIKDQRSSTHESSAGCSWTPCGAPWTASAPKLLIYSKNSISSR